MAVPVTDASKELGYFSLRSFLYAIGKGSAEPVAVGIRDYVPGILPVFTRTVGLTAEGVAGIFAIGLTAALSAGLTVMDYNHKLYTLKDLYKDELASLSGKSKDKVTVDDLSKLAKSNSSINEEINRSKKQRNFGVFLSFAASLVALSVVSFAVPPLLVSMGIISTVSAGTATWGAFFAAVAVKGTVGLATYQAVKTPLHAIADKLFGLEEKTTNDYIVAISRDRAAGKIISREQVLSAFVAANPELDNMIVAKYGKHFDDLDLPLKQRATQEVNQIIPLDRLTLDINAGKINVTELAFSVEGQVSGVYHDGHEQHQERQSGLRRFFSAIGARIHHSKVGHAAEHMATVVLAPPDNDITPVIKEESPTRSFVERLGLSKKEEMRYTDRVQQSREQGLAGINQ